MIKKLAIALEVLFAVVWVLVFTQGLNYLDEPSSGKVALGGILILASILVFPTVMRNVWKTASRHFNGHPKTEEKKHYEENAVGAAHSGCAGGPDGLRHDSH